MKTISFDGKVAIVTGGGHGLGKSYALELARRGARVVINDIGFSPGEEGKKLYHADQVVEEILSSGGDAAPEYNSVAEEATAAQIIETALEKYGTVDILICNAGIIRDRSFLKMTPEDFDSVMKVHLYGSYYTTRAAFPVMKEKGSGKILLTTSISGLFGNFGQSNYSSAKLGLVGFMNTLKEEGARYNIQVNTISPLAFTQDLTKIFPSAVAMFLEELPEHVKERYSAGSIVPMVLYLCSDSCTATGHLITAGGGVYRRVVIVENTGASFKDQPVTPEMISEEYINLSRVAGLTPYENGREYFIELFNAAMTC